MSSAYDSIMHKGSPYHDSDRQSIGEHSAFEISDWLQFTQPSNSPTSAVGLEGSACDIEKGRREMRYQGLEQQRDLHRVNEELFKVQRYPNTRSARSTLVGPGLRRSQEVVTSEAALSLLNLASNGGGSTTGSFSSSMLFDDMEFSAAEEDDSDSTTFSLHSHQLKSTHPSFRTEWSTATQILPPPSLFTGRSRTNSIASLAPGMGNGTSTPRVRSHRPARTQRAASETSSLVGGGKNGSLSRVMSFLEPLPLDAAGQRENNDSGEYAKESIEEGTKGKGKAGKGIKRARGTTSSSVAPVKKIRTTSSSHRPTRPIVIASSSTSTSAVAAPAPPALNAKTDRTFPASVQIDLQFARFYRRFPMSSASTMPPPDGSELKRNPDPFNLYNPRFVRGTLNDKSGCCPVCVEPVERGGEGVAKFLKLKNSSFVYHLSNYHGISNVTGLPLSPPISLRSVVANKEEKRGGGSRAMMKEGLCHKCKQWIPLLSSKNVDALVVELTWWKHAKPCHGKSTIVGETNYYVDDEVYQSVVKGTTGDTRRLGLSTL